MMVYSLYSFTKHDEDSNVKQIYGYYIFNKVDKKQLYNGVCLEDHDASLINFYCQLGNTFVCAMWCGPRIM